MRWPRSPKEVELVHSSLRGYRCVAVLVAAAALLAAVAGSARGGRPAPSASAAKPATAAQWKALVAQAKREGSVTFYTSHNPADVANLAQKFQDEYGIKVVVNRKVDNDLLTQVNTEMSTGNVSVDVWEMTPKRIVLGALGNGWVTDAVGPAFFARRYDRSKLLVGKAWIDGAAVGGMAWNTSAFPRGLKDVGDLLNPALRDGSFKGGAIGLPDPRISATTVDWYFWLQKTYGSTILQRLAAMEPKPKIYGSSVVIATAIGSGEIVGGPWASAGTVDQLRESGAPVGYALPNKGNAWTAAWMGMIMKRAPHPAAAQVFANYLVSPEGQSLLDHGIGSAYPNVPGTRYAPPRVARANDLAPAKVSAFVQQWSKLFQ
jgi:iron(III) transport system substrate-binding protein